MAEAKDRVLITGATGYLGRRLVKASLALGHPTFLLFRPDTASDLARCQMLMELKMEGAQLLQVTDRSLICCFKRYSCAQLMMSRISARLLDRRDRWTIATA